VDWLEFSKNDRKNMFILKEILVWFNKYRVLAVFSAVLFTSAPSLSSACFELECDTSLDSQEVVVNDTEYESDLVGTAYGLLKSGLSLLRENPLKAMTLFLALQSQGSSLSMPGAYAQLQVSNINQTHMYDSRSSNQMVALLPMVINGTVNPCKATIILSDRNAGNLTATAATGLSQEFDRGVWTSEGDVQGLSTMLSYLFLSIAGGYDRDFNLSVQVYDLPFPGVDRVRGTIRIWKAIAPTVPAADGGEPITTSPTISSAATTTVVAPTPISTTSRATTTSKNTAVTTVPSSTTPVVISTTPTGTDVVLSESVSTTQDATDLTVSSAAPQMPGTLTTSARVLTSLSETQISATSETMQVPAVDPEGEPPYALIGGVLGGGIACAGLIALVVAAKRGLLCAEDKKAIAGATPDPEKAVNEGRYAKVPIHRSDRIEMSNGYGKLSPQEGLPKPATKNHYATTVQIVENAKSVYSSLEGHEI
jgi:hypothetical protein